MADKCGPLVHLWGIDVASQLPPASATAEELTPLLKAMFTEAVPFIETLPAAAERGDGSSPWKAKGSKTFSRSAAPVELYERTVSAAPLAAAVEDHKPPGIDAKHVGSEMWAARRSVHENAAAAGTASWTEWTRCFKDEHAEAEKEFTATVVSTTRHRQWDLAGLELAIAGTTWTDWTLKYEESVHKLPAPLRRRVFPVLQATAAVQPARATDGQGQGGREFLVVQLAATRDGDDGTGTRGSDGAVRGSYTSVERLREVKRGDGIGGAGGQVEWIMATVSDAGGAVPGWVQRLVITGEVAKDVDMFLGWIAEERTKAKEGGAGPQ